MDLQYQNKNFNDKKNNTVESIRQEILRPMNASTGQFKALKFKKVTAPFSNQEFSERLDVIPECNEENDNDYCIILIKENIDSEKSGIERRRQLYVENPVINAGNFLTSKLTCLNKSSQFFKLFLCIELSFVCLLITMIILYVNTYLDSVIPVILYCIFLFLLILSRFIKNSRYIKPIYVLLFYLTVYYICESTLQWVYDYSISRNCKIYFYFILSINLLYTIIKSIIVYSKCNKLIYSLISLYFIELGLLFLMLKIPKVIFVGIIYCYFLFLISSYKINGDDQIEKALEWGYFLVLNIGFGIIVSCLSGIYVFKISRIYNVRLCFNL